MSYVPHGPKLVSFSRFASEVLAIAARSGRYHEVIRPQIAKNRQGHKL
jgi:hypothetical protein